MLKFQMGLIVLFIACVALISCESIQDMMTMPDPDMPDPAMPDPAMPDPAMPDPDYAGSRYARSRYAGS